MVAFGAALLMTGAAGEALRLIAPGAGSFIEVVVLTGTNVLATVCRYLLLREWMTWRLQVVTANGA